MATELTSKQASALDALRNGGTIADVAARLKTWPYGPAYKVVHRLKARGHLFEAYGPEGQVYWTLTESGRAAHLESLK